MTLQADGDGRDGPSHTVGRLAPTTERIGSLKSIPNEELPAYSERLRQVGDVVWDHEAKMWLVSSFEIAQRICLGDEREFQSDRIFSPDFDTFGMTEQEWLDSFHHGSDKKLGSLSGPEHDRMHRWWFRAFSPKLLAKWQNDLIEPIANARIDRLVGEGRAELCTQYCDPVIFEATAAVLGLPSKDRAWFRQMKALNEERPNSGDIQRVWGSVTSAAERTRMMHALVAPSVLAKRGGDGIDFASAVWRDAEEIFGARYEVRDVVAQVINALVGSIGSTDNVVASGLRLVMIQAGLQDTVERSGEVAVKRLVEETLRLYPNSWLRPRRVLVDMELGGVQLTRGDTVGILLYSVNRDPRHYLAADTVDLERKSPNDHLAFFLGPRTCAGQALARFTIQRVLAVALRRLSDLRLDPSAEPPRLEGNNIKHWRPLHALFNRR